ncbi:TIMELESS-interacting protein-like [Pomacea canaliculata]|uniref:TIMELESS-interacting protein-like n=1 Tax=Pomacea canaliculata TaxID=400727 RepID=UPI000D7317DC|nr:TIMELESS-interacting protein-like [Pomacea canaliculata]XP_025077354.1 TIMELESS-interacting protein-like [Pomacea canaliculata]
MESTALEMDDIFDDHDGVDEEDAIPNRLPDLPEGLINEEEQASQQDEEAENREVLAKLKGIKGASKHTVKRPMPKLDSIRLTGERGIPILPQVFRDVKLKGKGHEVDDLQVVMRYLEHWAHRLFPMMPFDEVLERIERLGTKKDVQTCIKKMRLDMPVLHQDMVNNLDEDFDGSLTDDNQHTTGQPMEDRFDKLVREANMKTAEENDRTNNTQRSSTSQLQNSASGVSDTDLSAEVLERIERNRQMALKRRVSKTSACDQNAHDRGAVRADHHTTAGCSAPIEQTSQQSVQSSSSTDSVTIPSGLP